VYVVGGEAAVSPTVYHQIDVIVSGAITRLGGATRYDTAVRIAQEFFPNPQVAALAGGENFPDALVGGVKAARLNAPILYVVRDKIPPAVDQYIRNHQATLTGFILCGGPSAIGENVGAAATQLLY
jgi:putative cell wall-binding protein